MKKLIVVIVMLMGVSASTSFAHDHMFVNNIVESDLSVKTLDGLKFKVTAFNLTDKSIVEVKAQGGDVLYKEVITEASFAKILNLASLPDGNYTIVLTSGEQSVKKPFEIKTQVVRNAVALSK